MPREYIIPSWVGACEKKPQARAKPLAPLIHRIIPGEKELDTLDTLEAELRSVEADYPPDILDAMHVALEVRRDKASARKARALGETPHKPPQKTVEKKVVQGKETRHNTHHKQGKTPGRILESRLLFSLVIIVIFFLFKG